MLIHQHATMSTVRPRQHARRRGHLHRMFLKALMIMIVAAGFAVAVPKAVRAITGLQAAPSAVQVVVQPGDTLWSIASRYGMGQSSRRDIRQVVWEIRKANNLSSAVIHPDMVLIIPAL